jgi:O-antigen/teichoic acid export membrane protein
MLKAGLLKSRELGRGPLAKASAISVVIRVAGLALGFAQAVLAARLLGAAGYGTVAVAMSIAQVIGMFCMLGFGPLAVRDIPASFAAGRAASVSHLLRHAFIVVLFVSAAGGLVVALAAATTGLVPAPYRRALEIGALVVAPFALIGLFRGFAQGFGRIALAQVPGEAMRPAASVLLMGTALLLGLPFGPTDYMWVAAGSAAFAALFAGAWLWHREWARLPTAAVPSDGRNFVLALPFLGLALVNLLQGEMNTLLLGWLASPHEAGVFQPIVRLTPVLTLAVQAAAMGYAPHVASLWERGERHRIRSATAKFTLTTSFLTLVAALAIAASGPLLMWIFGPEFRQSAPLLWYIAAAQVFNAACGPVAPLLTMSGGSGRALWGLVAGLVVNISVAAMLIPDHGASGAAIAMASGIVVWNVIMLAMVRARYRFDPSLAGVISKSIWH